MPAPELVTSLRLGGSGWLLQWGDDARWRAVAADQLAAELLGRHATAESDWTAWTGNPQWQARGARFDGRPGWFTVSGELPEGAVATVTLADGARPEVLLVGRVWGAAWHSLAQPVTVAVGTASTTLDYRRPAYLATSATADRDSGPTVRAATPADLDAVVALRRENGRVHHALDPTVYRVPEEAPVREHFTTALAEDDDRRAVLVAVEGERVLGMVEVSLDDAPALHQVLLPTRTARLHTVVDPGVRHGGVGGALEAAAARWAAARGASRLVAGIEAHNGPALGFYGWCGYRRHAEVHLRDL